MGVTALVALLHDVIVVVGVFAILGTFFGVQIDGLFVTAMLTVIGFSVHDTIVVFDRVRENRAATPASRSREIVNHSILQTFGRSITTSFTVVLTLLALLLFGGAATRVRPRAAARHHLGDLLVDLQREPAARGLAGVGGPSGAAGPAAARPARPGATGPHQPRSIAASRGRLTAPRQAAVSGAWHPAAS